MTIHISIPLWLQQLNEPRKFDSMASAMSQVIDAARRNIDEGGGPFGAAVLNDQLELVAIGVNRVIPSHTSILHAEILALLLAQQKLRSHDLSSLGRFTLVTSCEPCAMCFGAIPFSGIVKLVCGATKADAQAIGFDEGDKPEKWQDSLERRGISVVTDVLRNDAIAVLEDYRQKCGTLY